MSFAAIEPKFKVMIGNYTYRMNDEIDYIIRVRNIDW